MSKEVRVVDMRVFSWEPLTLPGGIVPAAAPCKYLQSLYDIRVQPLHKDPGVMKRTATECSLPGTRGGRGPMSQHNRFRTMLLVSAAGLLGLAGTTKAAPSTYVELVADCNEQGDDCGPRGENDGPGHEQARGTWFMDADGTPWVSVVVMSAKQIPNRDEGPYQCRYFAWKLDPIAGPQRMVD